jgi:hypothetical protein
MWISVSSPRVLAAQTSPPFGDCRSDEGSIFILHVLTDAAREWAADHLPEDTMSWGSDGIVSSIMRVSNGANFDDATNWRRKNGRATTLAPDRLHFRI